MSQIIGNNVPCKVGRKVYLAGYVSMSEFQTYNLLVGIDEVRALRKLLYYSLNRGNQLSERKVNRLIRKHPEAKLPILETIFSLSLPKLPPQDEEEPTGDIQKNEADERTVYGLLAIRFGWTPAEVGDMSPAQIFLTLTGGPTGDGTKKMSWSEFGEQNARRRRG